jgi:hypothetical protein
VRPLREAVQAAELRDEVEAGPQPQVVRVAEHDARARRSDLAGVSVFTEPCVPTGMKVGVGILRAAWSARSRATVTRDHAEVETIARRPHARLAINITSPYEKKR